MAVDAMKIVPLLGTFFVVWCFCSPHHFPTSSKYKREKRADIQHWCGEGRQMTECNAPRHCCHLCVVVFMCLCVHPWVPGKQSRLYLVKDKLTDGPQCFLTCLNPTCSPCFPCFPQFTDSICIKFDTVLTFICSKCFRTVLIHILSLILLGSSDAARIPARQLVLGCLLACCLRCWRPH